MHIRNTYVPRIYKDTKKFAERKQAHVGMKPSKTSQTRWERHHNSFTPSLHLVPFCQNSVCMCLLVVCRRGLSCRWKSVVWVCVHIVSMLFCWWLVVTVAGMVQVVCRSCGVGEEWWVWVVCWNVHYVKFYPCLAWQLWVVLYIGGYEVSSGNVSVCEEWVILWNSWMEWSTMFVLWLWVG